MESYCNKNVPSRRNNCGQQGRMPGQWQSEGRVRQGFEQQNREGCGTEVRKSDRNMTVECVCQVTPTKDCKRTDKMERLGNQFPPVMAYVPWQQWGNLYDADYGLKQGTIFKDLNYIFCGERW